MNPRMKWLCAPEDAPASPVAPATPPVPPVEPPPVVQTKGGKVLPMAATTIEKLKRDQEEKGRRKALGELDGKAQELGYRNHEDMMQQLTAAKNKPRGQQQPPKNGVNKNGPQGHGGQNGNGQGGKNGKQGSGQQSRQQPGNGSRRDDRRDREMRDRLDRERREKNRAVRRAQQAEQDKWATEAESELKLMAIGVGIKDPDYAVSLWTRECQGKDEAWLNAANEQAFFTDLKKSRPYLFQEAIVPANTGTVTPGNAPPPPGAGQVTQAQASAAQTNVRDMTREQYQEHLKKKGLRIPST